MFGRADYIGLGLSDAEIASDLSWNLAPATAKAIHDAAVQKAKDAEANRLLVGPWTAADYAGLGLSGALINEQLAWHNSPATAKAIYAAQAQAAADKQAKITALVTELQGLIAKDGAPGTPGSSFGVSRQDEIYGQLLGMGIKLDPTDLPYGVQPPTPPSADNSLLGQIGHGLQQVVKTVGNAIGQAYAPIIQATGPVGSAVAQVLETGPATLSILGGTQGASLAGQGIESVNKAAGVENVLNLDPNFNNSEFYREKVVPTVQIGGAVVVGVLTDGAGAAPAALAGSELDKGLGAQPGTGQFANAAPIIGAVAGTAIGTLLSGDSPPSSSPAKPPPSLAKVPSPPSTTPAPLSMATSITQPPGPPAVQQDWAWLLALLLFL